jgi:carbonic anhydrase/acetyltransferase-like protein (isoleucine patch superfamily)
MPLIPFRGVTPRVAEDVFIAPGAQVIGDVTIGAGSSVWYNVVIRGDHERIVIGRNSNIQDNSTLHADPGNPCIIEDEVSVGHGAVVHGCRVGSRALIGIHAIVLNGAEIGEEAIVGAGAVVGAGKSIPPRSLAVGVPAKVLREVTGEDTAENVARAHRYATLAQDHK